MQSRSAWSGKKSGFSNLEGLTVPIVFPGLCFETGLRGIEKRVDFDSELVCCKPIDFDGIFNSGNACSH